MKRTYIVPQIEVELIECNNTLLTASDKPGSGDSTIGNSGNTDYEGEYGIGPGTGGALAKQGGMFSFDDDDEFVDDEYDF